MKIVDTCLEIFPTLGILYSRQWLVNNWEACLEKTAAFVVAEGISTASGPGLTFREYLAARLRPKVAGAERDRADAHKRMRRACLHRAQAKAEKTGRGFDPAEFADILTEGGK